MDDWVPAFDLDEGAERAARRAKIEADVKRRRVIAGGILALLLAAGGGAIWMMRDDLRGVIARLSADAKSDAGIENLDAASDPGPELSAEAGDDLFAKLAREVSTEPIVAKWLEAPNLIQRLTAAVALLAEGKSPRPVLTFIDLGGELLVIERSETPPGAGARRPRRARGRAERPTAVEHIFLNPDSYARYDAMVRIVSAVEPARAAAIYRDLSPYFEAAYAQVAKPGERFSDVLGVSFRRVLAVKVPEDPIELVPKGAVYAFKDPELEALSAGDKQIIRMGPNNVEALKRAIISFAARADIPVIDQSAVR